jgi:hypothetical protein
MDFAKGLFNRMDRIYHGPKFIGFKRKGAISAWNISG